MLLVIVGADMNQVMTGWKVGIHVQDVSGITMRLSWYAGLNNIKVEP